MTVGKRLKQLRLERGLTQTEVGSIIGVTKGAIQKYECGEIVNFKADTIRKLSEFFEVPSICFIYDEIPNQDKNTHELLADYFGNWYLDFMTSFTTLNEEGQKKVISYCKDLTLIPEYKQKGDDNNERNES